MIFELHLIASTWSLSHTANALRKLVTYASFKRPAAVVPGAPLVEPVETGICRFFAGVVALLVDVADCEAASPRSLPEEIDSEIGRIGPRSIGIPQIGQALRPVYKDRGGPAQLGTRDWAGLKGHGADRDLALYGGQKRAAPGEGNSHVRWHRAPKGRFWVDYNSN